MYKSLLFSLTLLSFVFPSIHLTLGEVNTESGTLEVLMANDEDVGGFQFDLTGVTVTGASNGSAGAGGFFMSTSGTTVLGFSLTGATILPGDGLLVEVTFSDPDSEICLSDPVFSDPNGLEITTTSGECYSDDDGGGGGDITGKKLLLRNSDPLLFRCFSPNFISKKFEMFFPEN